MTFRTTITKVDHISGLATVSTTFLEGVETTEDPITHQISLGKYPGLQQYDILTCRGFPYKTKGASIGSNNSSFLYNSNFLSIYTPVAVGSGWVLRRNGRR